MPSLAVLHDPNAFAAIIYNVADQRTLLYDLGLVPTIL